MKKSIFISILVAVISLTAFGYVNAASVSADKAEVKAGEEVVVTVSTKDLQAIKFTLEFNPDYFTYTEGNTTTGLAQSSDTLKNGNSVVVAGLDTAKTTNQVSVKFTAKQDVEAKDVKFTVSGLDTEPAETIEQSVVSVSIVKATAEEPTEPEEPTKPSTDDKKPSDGKYIDDEGNEIKTTPQTGATVYVIAIAVIALAAGAVLVVKKYNK